MITSVHALIYSDDAPATRAFLRDVLGFPWVVDGDADDGWLIFGTGHSEVGVHPTSGPGYDLSQHHELALMCDDIAATRADLESKGATFAGDTADRGFGLVAMLELPGAGHIMLYEPKHAIAYDKS